MSSTSMMQLPINAERRAELTRLLRARGEEPTDRAILDEAERIFASGVTESLLMRTAFNAARGIRIR